MKNLTKKIRLVMIYLFILSFSSLQSQATQQMDSLTRILLIKSFGICNPPPQYIVEINNNRTISFYNNLPENFSQHQSELIKSWIIDSTTIIMDSIDFIVLEKLILDIDLKNIDNFKKRKPSKNGVVAEISGSLFETYVIETFNQTIEYNITGIPINELMDPFKTIRNLIGDLEAKYKP